MPQLHDIIRQGQTKRDNRHGWITTWEELAETFLPVREGFTGELTQGQERGYRNFSDAPQLARRGLSTALSTFNRPAGKIWLKAVTSNRGLMRVPEVIAWCQAVTQITYDALYHPDAHMERNMTEADNDLITFGTNCVKIGWNQKKRHLTYKTYHLKNIVIGVDEFNNVIAVWYFCKLPLRDIVEMFGVDKLTQQMKRAYQESPPRLDDKFDIVHACVPNKDWAGRFRPGDGDSMRPPDMPYLSLWWAEKDKEPLDVGGYWDFPYLVARWDTQSQEDYGRSPSMVALDSARLINEMARDMADAGANAVRPPLGAWGDFIAGDVQLHSGGLTLFDSQGKWDRNGNPIWTIETGAMPKEIFQMMEIIREDIKAAFFLHVLELPDARDTDMTATEVNARYDEFLRNGAPTFSRVESEYNGGHLNRVFSILNREGMYPPVPEILRATNENIEFEYESPLKQLRKRAEAVKTLEGMSMIGEGAMVMGEEKALEVSDNFSADGYARYMADKLDMPMELVKPFEEVMAIRKQRAEQAEMAMMAEMANKAAPAVAAAGNLPSQLLGPGSPVAEGGALEGADVPGALEAGADEAANVFGDDGGEPIDAEYEDVAA
jgi:hypothetical protein